MLLSSLASRTSSGRGRPGPPSYQVARDDTQLLPHPLTPGALQSIWLCPRCGPGSWPLLAATSPWKAETSGLGVENKEKECGGGTWQRARLALPVVISAQQAALPAQIPIQASIPTPGPTHRVLPGTCTVETGEDQVGRPGGETKWGDQVGRPGGETHRNRDTPSPGNPGATP